MNYKKHYDLLVSRGKSRVMKGYVEKHHIVPKCMNGSDDHTNIVYLTPEEHYLAHQLLIKIYPDNENLIYAVFLMTTDAYGHRISNKLFGWLRKRHAVTTSKLFKGKPKSEQTKQKMKKPKSESHKTTMSVMQKLRGGYGPKEHSESTKQKIAAWSEANSIFKETITCPHCGKTGKCGPLRRWHFDNCRKK